MGPGLKPTKPDPAPPPLKSASKEVRCGGVIVGRGGGAGEMDGCDDVDSDGRSSFTAIGLNQTK